LEWETEKRRFLNAIGDTGGSDLSQSFLLRPELSQVHDSTLGTRSALDSLEMIYADQVQKGKMKNLTFEWWNPFKFQANPFLVFEWLICTRWLPWLPF
jgi:hypothetical protein